MKAWKDLLIKFSIMYKKGNIISVAVFIAFAIFGCNDDLFNPESDQMQFGQPQKVTVTGYDGIIMEPFLSRDGKTLFFNNLNNPSVNTNLHIATKINDSVFQYNGELKGVNTEYLEGVPTMDENYKIYYVSTRSYDQTFSTIYNGDFNNDSISKNELVEGLSKNKAGWVNFDVEVSKDGKYLYFVDGRFDEKGGPYESSIVLAIKKSEVFERTDEKILENINTSDLEYAACISSNMLELYFTRLDLPISESSEPQIYLSTRKSISDPFKKPYKITQITGFVEGPTISPDDKTIYYHKKENDKSVLFMIKKI